MARDFTKYTINNSKALSKRALALELIKEFLKTEKPTFNSLKKEFPDTLQGSKGFLVKTSEPYDIKRFHKEILVSSDGVNFVVSNQWGSKNFPGLIQKGTELGLKVNKFDPDNQKVKAVSVESREDFSVSEGLKINKKEPIQKRENQVSEEDTTEKENEAFIKQFWQYLRPPNFKKLSVDDVMFMTLGPDRAQVILDLTSYVKRNNKFELDSFQKYYIDDGIKKYHNAWIMYGKTARDKKTNRLAPHIASESADNRLKMQYLRDSLEDFSKEYKKLRKKHKK